MASCVCNIKSNAVQNDELLIKYVKLILPNIRCYLTYIHNHCLTILCFPSIVYKWKVTSVAPIAKKAGASLLCELRPIGILTRLPQVLEMRIARQIYGSIDRNKLLNLPTQSGARAGHSCATVVVKVIYARQLLDQRYLTLLGFLDFSRILILLTSIYYKRN